MASFTAATHISAEPTRVWDALVQTDHWPAWDTTLDRVEGALVADGRVTIHVTDQPRAFKLKVVEWEPGRRVVLRGGMPLNLFTGTRTYNLSAEGEGTNVEMSEVYGGPLAGLFGKRLPDLQPSFEAFVAGWRTSAEGSSG